MKKIKMLILIIALCLANIGCVYAASDYESELLSSQGDVEPILDYSTARENPDGTVTYDVLNSEEVAEFLGEENAISVKYTVINQAPYEGPTPRAYELVNITYVGSMVGGLACAYDSAYNGTSTTVSKTLTLTGTVSNSNSVTMYAGGTISNVTVSAALGFDVTQSIQVSDTTTVSLPAWKTVTVTGYPRFHAYRYDIANNKGIFGYEEAGNGLAKQVYGMFTVTSMS